MELGFQQIKNKAPVRKVKWGQLTCWRSADLREHSRRSHDLLESSRRESTSYISGGPTLPVRSFLMDMRSLIRRMMERPGEEGGERLDEEMPFTT